MTDPSDAARPSFDSGQLQNAALKGAAWTMIHTVISVPIAFLVNVLLAQVLAPEGYGRLAFLTTLITLAASVLALGLAPAMIQFGAKAHAAGRTAEVTGILSSAQGFRLLVVAPVITVVVLLMVHVPWILLALAVAFGVWLPAVLNSAPVALTIENRTAANAKVALVSNLVTQSGVVLAILWIGTADSVWAARVVLASLGLGPAFWLMSRPYRRAILRPRLPRHFPVGFWRFALPTGIAGIIGELAVSRTEILILQWLATPTTVGLFALAFGVSNHVFAPAQALTGPLVPAVSGLREIGPDKVSRALLRTLRASSAVSALLIAGAVPTLSFLVPLVYGDEFKAAAPAVLVLGIVGGFAVTSGPLSAFVLARLSARLFLLANSVALAVDVLLALTLIPTMGLWGAVIANGAAILTRLSILLVSESRDLDVALHSVLSALTPTGIAALTSVLAWFAVGSAPISVVAQAVMGGAVAVSLLLLIMRVTGTGITHADATALLTIMPSRLKPVLARVMGLVVR